MAQLTPEQRSERSRKAAITRRNNKIAAENRANEQQTDSSRNRNWLPWVLLGLFALGLLLWHPWTMSTVAAPAATEVAPAATVAAPAATETAPVPIVCNTPDITTSIDSQTWLPKGEYLDTYLGKRMTFTSRSLLVPNKQWNDPLSPTELKTVEETWQFIRVCVPDGMFGRIFTGGFEQGLNRYENGVLMTLNPGFYEFRMRNGEVVLWYPNQETFSSKDLDRIVLQIRNGNFDIHAELAFFATTADLLPKIPADLVKKDNVQVIPAPDPTVQ